MYMYICPPPNPQPPPLPPLSSTHKRHTHTNNKTLSLSYILTITPQQTPSHLISSQVVKLFLAGPLAPSGLTLRSALLRSVLYTHICSIMYICIYMYIHKQTKYIYAHSPFFHNHPRLTLSTHTPSPSLSPFLSITAASVPRCSMPCSSAGPNRPPYSRRSRRRSSGRHCRWVGG